MDHIRWYSIEWQLGIHVNIVDAILETENENSEILRYSMTVNKLIYEETSNNSTSFSSFYNIF